VEVIYIADCLNTEYKEDQFGSIVSSHESNETNMNSTIKTQARIAQSV
jgi:hypothetical protein